MSGDVFGVAHQGQRGRDETLEAMLDVSYMLTAAETSSGQRR